MHQYWNSFYTGLMTLPDRLYPFACEIEGKLVRGRLAYEQALTRAVATYGPGRMGYKLLLYRETFHFIGALSFIVLAGVLSKVFFGSDTALYVLLGAAILALSYQEFYVHPRRYGQRTQKGMADWFAWVTPMVAYLFFIL